MAYPPTAAFGEFIIPLLKLRPVFQLGRRQQNALSHPLSCSGGIRIDVKEKIQADLKSVKLRAILFEVLMIIGVGPIF